MSACSTPLWLMPRSAKINEWAGASVAAPNDIHDTHKHVDVSCYGARLSEEQIHGEGDLICCNTSKCMVMATDKSTGERISFSFLGTFSLVPHLTLPCVIVCHLIYAEPMKFRKCLNTVVRPVTKLAFLALLKT